MPFSGAKHKFTEREIFTFASMGSGVYGLFTPTRWIYIGESENVEQRLLQHLTGDNACILNSSPTGFVFETVEAGKRVARRDQLVEELSPTCN
jgi:predicted GIY-YIG superfamily endonuclease